MAENLIKVDILVPAYKEPIDVIERMFKACHVQELSEKIDIRTWFCVDGATEEEEKRINDLARKYNINISKRPNRKGFRAGALNYCIQNNIFKNGDRKYIIVLDIDQAPRPNMTKVLAEQMEKEENKNTHFMMFPQIAENGNENAIANASDILQRYDYYFNRRIRSKTNSAFVVGTNWIGRADFVKNIPFEEESIVEDQASSIRWHANGANIKVINVELALGVAPDTIDGWRVQQARWSYGALFNLRYLPKYWSELTIWQKIDYLSVMSWYLYAVPTVFSILIPLVTFYEPITTANPLAPILLLFANIAIFTLPIIYCREKKLSITEVFKTAAIQHMCLDLYLNSIYSVITKKKFSYVTTDKSSKKCPNPNSKLLFPYTLVGVTTMGILYALYLNPPTVERIINAFEGAPLKYTTYIIYWLILGIFWIWGTIYYSHKSNSIAKDVKLQKEVTNTSTE